MEEMARDRGLSIGMFKSQQKYILDLLLDSHMTLGADEDRDRMDWEQQPWLGGYYTSILLDRHFFFCISFCMILAMFPFKPQRNYHILNKCAKRTALQERRTYNNGNLYRGRFC